MNVACMCAGQEEAKPEGTKQETRPIDMHLMRWRQISASLTSTLETSAVFVANVFLVFEESEWSLASPPLGYFVFIEMVRRCAFFQEESSIVSFVM